MKKESQSKYKFKNGKTAVRVRTVGKLIEHLQSLPKKMRLNSDFEKSIDVVIFNQGQKSMHVAFEEGGMWS